MIMKRVEMTKMNNGPLAVCICCKGRGYTKIRVRKPTIFETYYDEVTCRVCNGSGVARMRAA